MYARTPSDTDVPENALRSRVLSMPSTLGTNGVASRRSRSSELVAFADSRHSGYNRIAMFHLNEGHAALAAIELLRKSHGDNKGKALIKHVVAAGRELGSDVAVVYLENYDVTLAKKLIAGVDLWLNTPLPPLEASGTSGMKAAHNGVPSLSILDGWWLEGCIEGVTGWSIRP